MHAFDVLGDPVRRRILELLADGEQTSGAITAVIRAEFGISQPAVSQHLRVLREHGFALVRAEGARRLYAVDHVPLREVDVWLERFQGSGASTWTPWPPSWCAASGSAAPPTPLVQAATSTPTTGDNDNDEEDR